MSSSSPSTSADGRDSLPSDGGAPARPLLVDRLAHLERENERLRAANGDLRHENERLERCLKRRRRERRDVVEQYERQLRRRTTALERERAARTPQGSSDSDGLTAAALGVVRAVVERCPGLGRSA